jgi:hypothetical protein
MLGRGGGAGMGGGISSSAGSGLRAPPRWNASTCAQPCSTRSMKRAPMDGRCARKRYAVGANAVPGSATIASANVAAAAMPHLLHHAVVLVEAAAAG